MTKKPFTFIHDLGSLDNEARLAYLRAASEYFGLDPNLNALDTLWMPDDVGTRKLVAYARKGTTDMLRGIHGIEVLSLTPIAAFDGVVAYQAIGRDEKGKGRQEIAIGAHSTKGLEGEKLAFAVHTAQTRALRRLTLQFVGGGLLDASEVNSQTTDIGATAASLAQLAGSPAVIPPVPAPIVPPTTTPGKDITPEPPKAAAVQEVVKTMQTLRDEATKHLNERAQKTVDPLDNPPPAPVEPTPEPKKRTPRKKRGVDISSPGQVSAVAEIASNSEKTPTADISESQRTPTSEVRTVVVGSTIDPLAVHTVQVTVPVPETAVPKKKKSRLTDEQLAIYQPRFNFYSQKVLVDGNMQSAVNMGVTTKLRKFAALQTGTEINEMSVPQWESFLGFLDEFMKTHTPIELVAHINKALGVD